MQGDDVKGKEEDDVENDDVEEEDDDDTDDADVEEGDRSQDRAACFVRACAVEMQVNISQEPFCTETDRKSARAQKLGAHFVQACAVEMQVNISQEPLYMVIFEIYRKNAAVQIEPRTQTHTLCEPAQSKCKSAFHKSHFIW